MTEQPAPAAGRRWLLALAAPLLAWGAPATAAPAAPRDALSSPSFLEELEAHVGGSRAKVEAIARRGVAGDRLAEARLCALLSQPRTPLWQVDSRAALAACRRLAEARLPLGMYLYGRVLDDGLHLPRDYPGAFHWYREAAAHGNALAMLGLGRAYHLGYGVAADAAQAMQWLRRGAALGCPGAMAHIGLMHAEGLGVPRDEALGRRWYLQAANRGNAFAMNNLGSMWGAGRGGARDESAAAAWFTRAAKLGNPLAMHNVARMYETGTGVRRDERKALEWYSAAARQMDAHAMFRLALMHHEGRGTPRRDEKGALAWFGLALKNADPALRREIVRAMRELEDRSAGIEAGKGDHEEHQRDQRQHSKQAAGRSAP